jgi:hypothetical protein
MRSWNCCPILGPNRIIQEHAALMAAPSSQLDLPDLVMPAHHDVRASDVFIRRLHGTLAAAADRGPSDFAQLLLTRSIALSRVMEVISFTVAYAELAPR